MFTTQPTKVNHDVMKSTILVTGEAHQYAIESMRIIANAISLANLDTAHRRYKNGCHEFDFKSIKDAKSALRYAWAQIRCHNSVSIAEGISNDGSKLFYDAGCALIESDHEMQN